MSEALNVLLVESSAERAQWISNLLGEGSVVGRLLIEPDLERAAASLSAASFDIILLDLELPHGSGLQAFARLQLAAGAAPIVVLVGEHNEALGMKAVQAGAAEYLLLPALHRTLLRRALSHAVERGRTGRRIEMQAQLLEQVGEAVIAVDNHGVIVFWNRAAQTLYGWHSDEVIGRPLSAIMPVSPELESAGDGRKGDGAERWSGEVESRRRDGSAILVSITVTPLRDSAGTVIGRVGVSSDVTERRAAEAALRESEQRLRLFVESIPTILWTTDRDQRITSMAGAGIARVGGSAGRAIGRLIGEYAPDLHEDQSRRALEGEAVSTEIEWGGHTFDLHIEPLRAADGAITGTIGIALDVTERRRSEQEAAQYFELLRTIVAAAPIAIIVVDASDRISLWNQAAERMFGWSSEEVVGGLVQHVPPSERALFERCRRRAAADVRPEKMLTSRVTKDGRVLDVEVIITSITGHDGRYHGTMSIVEDVTYRRLAAERQERLTAIIEASPDFVGTFDVGRNTLYINRAGRRLVGLEVGQSVDGTTLDQFCTVSTAELLDREALPRALANGTWTGEGTLRGLDGTEISVWLTLVAHRGVDGVLTFISVVAHDISVRRMLEDQLRQSQKMEAVGRLAGGVAHDFNNLLTAIAGHAEMLLADLGGSAQTRSDLEEVLGAVDRASALTRQLLAFSRRQVLQPRLLDLNQVVSDIGRLLRRLIGDDVNLITRLADTAACVRGDRGQVEQVIMNLVVNARDALPAGGTVTVTTAMAEFAADADEVHRGAAPGRYVELAVHDNGAGMDEILMTRIFEPFFTTKEQGKGTGLGLPTVYGIVTQSGGHILVDSEPGTGSTFRVLLPAADEEKAAAGEAERSAPARVGSETLLLVEDESAVRRLGCRILERRGYTVLEADSGAGAIQVFERMAPVISLLVTDVVMPGMSGVELARRLRMMKPSLRVLYTSGYTADEIQRHGALDAGTGFLEKPFTPDALAQKVQDILDGEV